MLCPSFLGLWVSEWSVQSPHTHTHTPLPLILPSAGRPGRGGPAPRPPGGRGARGGGAGGPTPHPPTIIPPHTPTHHHPTHTPPPPPPQARDELIDSVCRRETGVYTQIFGTIGETARLERTVNRYKWLLKRLEARQEVCVGGIGGGGVGCFKPAW
jgi:hypothetical protein